MRKAILIYGIFQLLFANPQVFGQNLKAHVGPNVRKIDVSGSRAELWVKANVFLVEYFNKANEVVHFMDKESGVIAGKYLLVGDTRVFFLIQADNNSLTVTMKPDIPSGVIEYMEPLDKVNEYSTTFFELIEQYFKQNIKPIDIIIDDYKL